MPVLCADLTVFRGAVRVAICAGGRVQELGLVIYGEPVC